MYLPLMILPDAGTRGDGDGHGGEQQGHDAHHGRQLRLPLRLEHLRILHERAGGGSAGT